MSEDNLDTRDLRQVLEPAEPLPQNREITIQEFIRSFEMAEKGKLYDLARFPIKEEALLLTNISHEIVVIRSKNGRSYIAKGLSEGNIGIPREEIVSLDPELVAHTHPPHEEIKDLNKRKFKESLPSSADLTTYEYGASENYIWNQFGRVRFQPLTMKKLKHSEQIIENVMVAAAREGKKHKPQTVEEGFEIISKYLDEKLGCSFKFEAWEEVGKL